MFEGLEQDSDPIEKVNQRMPQFPTDSVTYIELVFHNKEMAAVTHRKRAREHDRRYRILMHRVLIMKHVL